MLAMHVKAQSVTHVQAQQQPKGAELAGQSTPALPHVAVVTSRETMERLGWRLRLLGATPDTLEQMTGIKERRMWEKGTTGVQVTDHTVRDLGQ
jgi:hypothetical protein